MMKECIHSKHLLDVAEKNIKKCKVLTMAKFRYK